MASDWALLGEELRRVAGEQEGRQETWGRGEGWGSHYQVWGRGEGWGNHYCRSICRRERGHDLSLTIQPYQVTSHWRKPKLYS